MDKLNGKSIALLCLFVLTVSLNSSCSRNKGYGCYYGMQELPTQSNKALINADVNMYNPKEQTISLTGV